MSSDQSILYRSVRLTSHVALQLQRFFCARNGLLGESLQSVFRTVGGLIQNSGSIFVMICLIVFGYHSSCFMIYKRMHMTICLVLPYIYVLCIFMIKTSEKAYFPATDSNTSKRESEQLTSGASPNSTPPWASLIKIGILKQCHPGEWINKYIYIYISIIDISFVHMGLSLEGLYVSRTRLQTVKITSPDVHWVMLNEPVYVYIIGMSNLNATLTIKYPYPMISNDNPGVINEQPCLFNWGVLTRMIVSCPCQSSEAIIIIIIIITTTTIIIIIIIVVEDFKCQPSEWISKKFGRHSSW